MRIAFLVHGFPGLSETFILNQIVGLLELGHDVEIFAQHDYAEKIVHPDVVTYDLMKRVHYVPKGKMERIMGSLVPLSRQLGDWKCFLSALFRSLNCGYAGRSLIPLYLYSRFLKKGFDIIQCHYGPNGVIGICLKDLGIKAKVVTIFHGYDLRLAVQNQNRVFRRLFGRGDCFLAIAEYTREKLTGLGVNPQKIFLHPVGIDISRFPYRQRVFDGRLPKPLVLLTVARLVPEKGLHYCLRAIGRLMALNPGLDVEYRIIGYGELEKDLQAEARALGLEDIVRFLGAMDQGGVVKNMCEAHIFVLGSVAETLPVVLMEAQAVGLPVVATLVAGTKEVVLDGRSGFLIPPGDVQALTERLCYLVQHPESWFDMGRHGRRFVGKKFNVRLLNSKLEEILESIVKEQRGEGNQR